MSSVKAQPNILFILVDQQRYDSLASSGHPLVKTPNLDRLAAQGVRFTRAYTACALSSPVRASIMTGLYPHTHQVLTNVHDYQSTLNLSPEHPTFATMLKEAGYRTGYSGKWHVAKTLGPQAYGFDDVFTENLGPRLESKCPPSNATWSRRTSDETVLTMPHGSLTVAGRLEEPKEVMQEHRALTHGLKFLRDYAGTPKQPFFLRVDFFGPHLPCIVPEPYASMYKPEDVPDDPTFYDQFVGKPWIQKDMQRRWGTDKLNWNDWRKVRARYYGYITMIDDYIGQLLAQLDQSGLAENTLVIYSSDHGDACGSRGMVDKGYCGYEELYHVPMIARWPGVTHAGEVCDRFTNHVDLMPTFLQAGQCKVPQDMPQHGRSLIPLLEGKPPSNWPSYTVSEFHGMQWGYYSQRIVRSERYKLVFNATDLCELYDLESDPWELTNRYEDPAMAAFANNTSTTCWSGWNIHGIPSSEICSGVVVMTRR
ncbi:MAG: sulfatase-like hydrolase/transferase [Phycisphaerales bacterium]|nr:sulfatase-like hydrolase/transferase [Phycisphaerales bacterium]